MGEQCGHGCRCVFLAVNMQEMTSMLRFTEVGLHIRPYKNAALQCSGKVIPTIWCRNMDIVNAETRRAENQAFHMFCQRRILGIRWYDFISNAEVVDRTCEESIAGAQVQRRRLALFGHIRLLSDTVPANAALRLCIDARVGRQVDVRST